MTQMRHNNLANTLPLVISASSCQSGAEHRYRALDGKKARRDGIMARDGIVAAVGAHASAQAYAAQAAKTAGWTAAKLNRPSGQWKNEKPIIHKIPMIPMIHPPGSWCILVCAVYVRVRGQGGNAIREPPWDIASESGRIPICA